MNYIIYRKGIFVSWLHNYFHTQYYTKLTKHYDGLVTKSGPCVLGCIINKF